MRSLFTALTLLFSILLTPAAAFAAGTNVLTSTQTYDLSFSHPQKLMKKYTIDFVADAAAATVPNLSITLKGYLIKVVTNPGSTAPTANYDIALGDPDDSALDALGGALANRHTTTTEQVYPTITGATTPLLLNGTYTLSVANNAVNSASGKIILYVVDQP
jgi:hypothetical protein